MDIKCFLDTQGTQALMNVPYGNPHGPIVDCCTLHFSIPYTHVSFLLY